MPDRLADWLALVDGMHPFRDAEAWDAVGLHVGDPDDEVTGVLVALDVTAAVLDEAVEVGADLLLAHHPLLFRPLDRLTPATAPGRLALLAARLGVAVAAAHAHLDVAAEGTSHPAARVLQLRDLAPLRTVTGPPRAKLVTFVPPEATEGVLEALSAAGAGVIGEYDACSFRLRGTGTFRPSAQANPHTGERGRINEVTEDRVEVVLPASAARRVVAALVAAHPYEEVAYDLYPLVDEPAAGKGLGLVGTLPTPLPLGQVAARLRSALPSPGLRVAGDLVRPVERVAV